MEDGVVWQVLTERDIRWQLEFACETRERALNNFHGFDGDKFDEEYYTTLALISREADEGIDAAEVVEQEQHRRYMEQYGWLFKIGTSTN